MVDHGTRNHNNRSYGVCMTVTGCIKIRTANQVKQSPISTEWYLYGKVTEGKNQLQHDDEFDKLVNAYTCKDRQYQLKNRY